MKEAEYVKKYLNEEVETFFDILSSRCQYHIDLIAFFSKQMISLQTMITLEMLDLRLSSFLSLGSLVCFPQM